MRNKDVLWFDIAVYYALFMEVCDRSGDLVQYFAYSVDFGDLGGESFVVLGPRGVLLRHVFQDLVL